MKPVEFAVMTHKLTGEGCEPLPIHFSDGKYVSCWEVTDEDLKILTESRRIWLIIVQPFHPPVSLTTEFPFSQPAEELFNDDIIKEPEP